MFERSRRCRCSTNSRTSGGGGLRFLRLRFRVVFVVRVGIRALAQFNALAAGFAAREGTHSIPQTQA